LLAAFGVAESELDGQAARQYVGAILLLEAFADLRMLRKALTKKAKS
jgi:hypothetical protein